MCIMVYIAASRALPHVDWKEAAPAFHAIPMRESDPATPLVRRWLGMPELVQVGSSEGCGCGFSFDPADPPKSRSITAAESDMAAFRVYLRSVIDEVGPVRVLATWDGEESEAPEAEFDSTPEALTTASFSANERRLYRLT